MGLDAAIMEGVNEQIKAKVGWFAYVLSGAKAMMSPVVRMEISVDDGEFTPHRARTVVVGNVGSLQAGMPLLPDAAIDDGLLDVVLLYPEAVPVLAPAGLPGARQAAAHRRDHRPDAGRTGHHPGRLTHSPPARRRPARRRQGAADDLSSRPGPGPRPPIVRESVGYPADPQSPKAVKERLKQARPRFLATSVGGVYAVAPRGAHAKTRNRPGRASATRV